MEFGLNSFLVYLKWIAALALCSDIGDKEAVLTGVGLLVSDSLCDLNGFCWTSLHTPPPIISWWHMMSAEWGHWQGKTFLWQNSILETISLAVLQLFIECEMYLCVGGNKNHENGMAALLQICNHSVHFSILRYLPSEKISQWNAHYSSIWSAVKKLPASCIALF